MDRLGNFNFFSVDVKECQHFVYFAKFNFDEGFTSTDIPMVSISS